MREGRPLLGGVMIALGLVAAVFGVLGATDVLEDLSGQAEPIAKDYIAAPLALILACMLLWRGGRMLRARP